MVLNGVLSQPLTVLSGVLPGSLWSPIVSFIYQWHLWCRNFKWIQTCSLCEHPPVSGCPLSRWPYSGASWSMLIPWLHGVPPSLIQLIWTVFISRRWSRKTEQSPLFLNESLIEAVDCIKYLQISIASDLSCTNIFSPSSLRLEGWWVYCSDISPHSPLYVLHR